MTRKKVDTQSGVRAAMQTGNSAEENQINTKILCHYKSMVAGNARIQEQARILFATQIV